MTKYMKNHEAYLLAQMEVAPSEELHLLHLKQIQWLQHERLIHLLVLMLTTIIFIAGVIGLYFIEDLKFMTITAILGFLEVFYMLHYFRLENTVQRWYVLDQELLKSIHGQD